jgi:hypothetical protein
LTDPNLFALKTHRTEPRPQMVTLMDSMAGFLASKILLPERMLPIYPHGSQ